jgi:hypothetical protein
MSDNSSSPRDSGIDSNQTGGSPMGEHPLAGETVTLLIDGKEEEHRLEEGISQEEGEAFINSMLGVDVPESPTEVDHPELELADIPVSEYPEPEGLRTVCRVNGCDRTKVFIGLGEIKDSEWTELGMPKGLLTDKTDLHYAYCPSHSLSEEDNYQPEKDMASHEFDGRVPNAVKEGLDE